MSNESTPAPRGLFPLWALLLLPLALFLGWRVGDLPVRSRPVAPPPVHVAATRQHVTPIIGGSGGTSAAIADPAPLETEKPKAEDEPPAVISAWTTFSDAVAQSQQNDKPVLIDFNAEWCGPCQSMRQEVFDDAVRGHAVQAAVIPVSIVDQSRETGSNPPEMQTLYERYNVDAFPTLVVFSPRTGRTLRTQGFGDAERTLEWITAAAKAVR